PPSNAPFPFLESDRPLPDICSPRTAGPQPRDVLRLALPDARAAEATLPARDDFLVVDVVGDLAAQGPQDGLGRPGDAGAEAAADVVGHHVRREQHPVAEIAQLAVEREWLFLEHVERGA